MAASRDDTTIDLVIACLRAALVSGVLSVFAVFLPDGVAQRALFAVALTAGAAAAAHYLVRRGHALRRPGRVSDGSE